MSDVAVIVLDINGGAMLRACLDSIAAQTLPAAELVVWDNSETNLGFAGGNNEAWKRTTAEFVALVNNDVVLDRDWLETVRAAMADDVAAVQTMIRASDGTIDGAGIDVSDGTIRQVRGEGTGHRERGTGDVLATTTTCAPFPVPRPLPAWGVSATAALYRRNAVGDRPFDPRFFAYYEDVELCARLHESGWRTIVLPVVKASHRGSASASVLGKDAQRLRTRNRYFVARLHPGVGRIWALLWEDAKLLLRGRASLRGLIEGLFSRL
ncbi:MAG TPA: glycosyltransferase family 2 protein [Thermoanaerobaculia bacterium]|nr:glycosyltransferase family 2 protein [Thermoanaerobaculia bacterium]